MCGIAGCVVEEGVRLDLMVLDRMADALGHRGPDDRRIEVDGRVGLVSTRLAIVDPGEAGRQPMRHPSGQWLLAYNGEIYNHGELRSALPGPFVGKSDTETLLHCLDGWGCAAISRCNGIFAFAALDTRRRRVFLVRDHLGVKPLYVARDGRGLWFASEIKALLAAGIPRRPRRDLVAASLVTGWTHGRLTHIEGIDRVPPGTISEVDIDTLRMRETRWYDLGEVVDATVASELARYDHGELVDRLQETLRRAVRRQLMSDAPLGVMCSGGVDSSLLTALAHEAKPDVKVFSASMVGMPRDEAHRAAKVAGELGIDVSIAPVTPSVWRETFVSSTWEYEYPAFTAGLTLISALARRARDEGFKVLLTGEGSDELFGGYGLNPGWRHAWRMLRPSKRPLWVFHAVRALLGGSSVRGLYRSFKRPAPLVSWAAPTGRMRQETTNDARHAYTHHEGARRELEAAMLAELTAGTLPALLNRMDKNAMAASVEARVPYLDHEVISLVVNLPAEARIGPRPKRVLRDVARRFLSPSVAYRPKQAGISIDRRRYLEPADPNFLDQGNLRDMLEVPLEQWRERVSDPSSPVFLRAWSAEIWCRLFLEGQAVDAVENALWAG